MSSDIEELACVSGEGVAMTASGSLSKSTKKSIRGTGPLSFSTRSRFPMSAPPIKGRRGGGGGGELPLTHRSVGTQHSSLKLYLAISG